MKSVIKLQDVWKTYKMGLNMLIHSKLRSWLTIIGIVIGVAAVVAIISMGEGMQESLSNIETDIITISLGGGGPPGSGGGGTTETQNLTSKDISAITLVDNIDAISGTVSGRGEVYYLGEKASVTIEGVDPLSWKKITSSELSVGRFLESSDYASVVIGSGLVEDTFKQHIGVNRMITIEGKTFKVVGILEESGTMGGNDRTIIMPIKSVRDILDGVGNNEFDSITVKVTDDSLLEETMEKIEERLRLLRHVTERTQDFSVSSSQSMMETVSETTESMTLFLAAIAAVSLLVGAVGIANTMFTTVLEKTREIGIMKAMGAKNRDILSIFLFNSILVGVVGGTFGILLGIFASGFMSTGTM